MSLSRESVPDCLVSPHKEAISDFSSSPLLCSLPFHSPTSLLSCQVSRSRCSIGHGTVIYSDIWFSHMYYLGVITKVSHLPYFYPVSQYHDILLHLFTVSLMTTDHFISTPNLVSSLLTLSFKSFMTRLNNRCSRIGSVGSWYVLLLLVPHTVFMLLKSNAFYPWIQQN